MSEDRPWENGSPQLLQLQEKVNTYVGFVESGQLAEEVPHAAGRPVKFELMTLYPLHGMALDLVERLRDFLQEKLQIEFLVTTHPEEYRLLHEAGMPESEILALAESGKTASELRAIAETYEKPRGFRGLMRRNR